MGILLGLLFTPFTGGARPVRAASAAGHTYVVNSTLDEPDANLANGVCASTPSSQCTLRAAIMESNYAAGPNTIILPAGTYTLTRPGYDDTAQNGDLDIGHDLTLQGAGSAATIVDGNGAVTGDRAFQVLSSTTHVNFTGLTIRNGRSLSSTVGAIGGGGIYVEGAGSMTLSDVILEGNTGQSGGGLYANFYDQGGSLELDHVVARANAATGYGGGIDVFIPSTPSTVDLRDSQVYSNTAGGAGGGLDVEGSNAAHWSIERSQIYSNAAAYNGGGIFAAVPLSLSDSRLHDNNAGSDGGAMEADAAYTMTRTTLEANTAGRYGGAVFESQPLRIFSYPNSANIAQSTLGGNSAQYGGAIYHSGHTTLTLLNSTVSGNSAGRDGGGLFVFGGAVQLVNATIAGNQVPLGFFPHPNPGIGGGLYLTVTSVLTAENTIIANNVRSNGVSLPHPDDCYSSDTTGTLAYDLIQTTTNCFVSGPQIGLIVGQYPLLGPLQDNGGSTQTQALLPGSPAIDAGAPTGCTDADGSPLATDQRGAQRTDGHCDIGAFEAVPEADLAVGERVSADPVPVGAPLTYTLTITNHGPVDATGIVLTDILPGNVTFSRVATPQGSCGGSLTVTCDLGALTSGSHIGVSVVVTTTAAGRIPDAVTVTGNEFDPVLADNTASRAATVLWLLCLPLVQSGP